MFSGGHEARTSFSIDRNIIINYHMILRACVIVEDNAVASNALSRLRHNSRFNSFITKHT